MPSSNKRKRTLPGSAFRTPLPMDTIDKRRLYYDNSREMLQAKYSLDKTDDPKKILSDMIAMGNNWENEEMEKVLLTSPLVRIIQSILWKWNVQNIEARVRANINKTAPPSKNCNVSHFSLDKVYSKAAMFNILESSPTVSTKEDLPKNSALLKDLTENDYLEQLESKLNSVEVTPRAYCTQTLPLLSKRYDDVKVDTVNHMPSPVPIKTVLTIVHILVNKVIPFELFGNKGNMKRFMKLVKSILTSGIKDTILCSKIVENISVKKCRWAETLDSNQLQTEAIKRVFLWVIQTIIFPVVACFFYATETDSFRNLVVFYRKSEWKKMKAESFKKLLHANRLVKSSLNTLSPSMSELPQVRFIPKRTGMRPIYPKIKRNDPLFCKAKILLSQILKKYDSTSLKIINRSKLASIWSNCVQQWRYEENLYLLQFDITDAYGSISQNKMVQILSEEIAHFSRDITFGCYSYIQANRMYGMKYILLNSYDEPTESLKTEDGGVMVSTGKKIYIDTMKVLDYLTNYVQNTCISMGDDNYRVATGLAQGGNLSAHLCVLYYACLYKALWAPYLKDSDVLLQSADDFLFASCDYHRASAFLKKVVDGNSEFNYRVNPSKTVENITNEGKSLRVRFSEIIICSTTRQILVPIAQLASVPPRYTMKINCNNKPGAFLLMKMKQIVSARIRSFSFCQSYTSERCVLNNCFRVGIVTAARLQPLCLVLLHFKINNRGRFFYRLLKILARLVTNKIRRIRSTPASECKTLEHLVSDSFLNGISTVLGKRPNPQLVSLKRSLDKLQKCFK